VQGAETGCSGRKSRDTMKPLCVSWLFLAAVDLAGLPAGV
jgi:hypothetical protein